MDAEFLKNTDNTMLLKQDKDKIRLYAGKFWRNLRDYASIWLFFIFWEAGTRLGLLDRNFISPPTVIFKTIFSLFSDGVMFEHIAYSLWRAANGFLAAVAVGVPLGMALGGWFKLFERVLKPVLNFLHAANPFSLHPVFIMLFGIGELSKAAMIFWVCIWPVLLNTITGVQCVDPLYIKAARSMGVSKFSMFCRVLLPGALPGIFHGIKSSGGAAFFLLVAAEMIGASSGLGWLVWNAQTNYQIPNLYAATVCIAVLGLLLNYLFSYIEKRVVAWKPADPEY
ncbi:MAG: ABC transporter permease [Acidaminococcales bacterium]|jgi:NitT/TauT family transport system permease protein|nr:ABC transporter permease [Acidaminococcales bacterium]